MGRQCYTDISNAPQTPDKRTVDFRYRAEIRISVHGVRKNGTGAIYGINTTKCFNSGEPYGLSANGTIPGFFTAGDYLELYVSAPSNGDVVTVQKVNWYTDSK